MSSENNSFQLPDRAKILEILQTIKNPFDDTHTQSIVEAGFITAPLSRMIDNEPQIGFIFDVGNKDAKIAKQLEVEITKVLAEKTQVTNINLLSPNIEAAPKHSLISNMPSAGIKPQAQRQPTKQQPMGHRPLGVLGSTAKKSTLENVKHIVLVASGKGGVGKSTVAANLTMAFAADGFKVGLLDADIYGPSMPTMFDLHEKPKLNDDKQMMPLEKYGVKLMSIGFIADTNKAMIWRGPMIQGALLQMLNECDWGELDYLVIDLPPGTGDIQLTLVQKFKIAGAIIVSTPQILALDDVRRGIQMFTTTHVPILGIVENMAWFESADGVKNYVFGKGGARMIADKIKVDLLAEIPLLPVIGQQSDMGEPIVHLAPYSIEASHYRKLAKAVTAKLSAKD